MLVPLGSALTPSATGLASSARPRSARPARAGGAVAGTAAARSTATAAATLAGLGAARGFGGGGAQLPSTRRRVGAVSSAEAERAAGALHEVSDADWAESVGLSRDGLGCTVADPLLAQHQPHLSYRWTQFIKRLRQLSALEGGLEEFSRGYATYGITRDEGATVYREWAPAASAAWLIGDFNGWDGAAHPLSKDQFGVWSTRLPDGPDGQPAIPHGSRVKVDRIPAYIPYATAPAGKMGATYDGVHWAPPEPYQWRHAAPPAPAAPRIYEAHVGMSSPEPKVNSYRAFADDVLPRIKAGGYNTVQLMAVQEHAYYASFGYHVTNFFAVSSRSGTPDDLKYLVDSAHGLGLRVLLDVVHSHASANVADGLNGFDFGQAAEASYFHTGPRGYHSLWDSRCFNYGGWEAQRLLLSNVRWWLEEYRFDGFRFDGVTSMLYTHHGIGRAFSGDYGEYFGLDTDVEAVVYLMLANALVARLRPDATVVAEDVSGMPTLCRPVAEGGVGFTHRLAMAVPDYWIRLLKGVRDEDWGMHELVVQLCNRRYSERCVAYAESHDQALVGDKTIAMWLMDAEMYTGMSTLTGPPSVVVERGVALHKVIRGVTLALGGEGWLCFMGNEFGHPEWVDFPREGNGWSHAHCRRRFDLADDGALRYAQLGAFDRALMELEERFRFLASPHQVVSLASDFDKVIVAERGDLLFVFNFHPANDYEGYCVPCPEAGTWHCVLDSDQVDFGGRSRLGLGTDHFTVPDAPRAWVGPYEQEKRACGLFVRSPPRSMQAYARAPAAAHAPPPAEEAAVAAEEAGAVEAEAA